MKTWTAEEATGVIVEPACFHIEPQGYLGWCFWAQKKAQTHRQRRCPTCGLWKIWVRKTKRKK